MTMMHLYLDVLGWTDTEDSRSKNQTWIVKPLLPLAFKKVKPSSQSGAASVLLDGGSTLSRVNITVERRTLRL